MGRRDGKMRQEAAVPDEEIEEVDIGDIQALARASLNPGEVVLDDQAAQNTNVEPRGVCNAPALRSKNEELQYKIPEGAKRVPWVDTLVVDGQSDKPSTLTAKDGVKLESAFLSMAGEGVKEAFRRLKVMNVPFNRPTDFYAEMLKTDKQMYLIKQRAAEEQRRIKIVENRRNNQAAKKFAKKAKTKKLEAKAKERAENLDDIKTWRKNNKKDNADDKDLEAILDKTHHNKQKAKLPVKSAKRQAADSKFGCGGKRKYAKSNTADSTNDMQSSPWAKRRSKGQGKGKGAGKGGGKMKRKAGAGGGPMRKRGKK